MKDRGYLLIVLMILASIILVVAGVFILLRRSSPVPTQTTSSDPGKTSEWTNYSNERVGYAFEYPSSGLILGLSEPVKYEGKDNQKRDVVTFTSKATYTIKAFLGVLNSGDTIETYLQKTSGFDNNLSNYKKTTLDGKTAYSYKNYDLLLSFYNSNIYIITASEGISPLKDKNDPVLDHMVSTFKFIPDKVPLITPRTIETPQTSEGQPIKSFTIMANEGGALPSNISVPSWSIISLTFSISSKIGLEFRSGTTTTGIINPGETRTLTFIVMQPMEFSVYSGSGALLPYSIKVNVAENSP